MTHLGRFTLFLAGVIVGIVLGAAAISAAHARDLGQWEQADPAIKDWYANLRRPDHPELTCCGEADGYWADSFEQKAGQYVAIITDGRTVPGRKPRPVGMRILIPPAKIKFDQGNPTGHGIVFIAAYGDQDNPEVLCYLPPGGG